MHKVWMAWKVRLAPPGPPVHRVSRDLPVQLVRRAQQALLAPPVHRVSRDLPVPLVQLD